MSETLTLPVSRISLPVEDRQKSMVGSDGYEALKVSLRTKGMLTPVFVDARRKLVSGYYRLRAWAELGNKDVPVMYAESVEDVVKLTVGVDWYDRVKEQKIISPVS